MAAAASLKDGLTFAMKKAIKAAKQYQNEQNNNKPNDNDEIPTNMGSEVVTSSKDVKAIPRDEMLRRVQMEFEVQDKKNGQKSPEKPPIVIETKYDSTNMFPVNPNLGSASIKQTAFRAVTSNTPDDQLVMPKVDDFIREMSVRFVNTLANKRNTKEEATAALIRDVKKKQEH